VVVVVVVVVDSCCGLSDNERKYLPLSLVFIHFSFTHPEQKMHVTCEI